MSGYDRHWQAVTRAAALAVADEAGAARPVLRRTPHPTAAAQLAAHAVRYRLAGGDELWLHILGSREVADAVDARSLDTRFVAGMAVLRAVADTSGTPDDRVEPVRMIGRWLVADTETATAASGHLCRWIHPRLGTWTPQLRLAWYRRYGPHRVGMLAHRLDRGPGRPAADQEPGRAALRLAVVRTWQAGRLTKTALAERAGISRPTLDAWLDGADPPPC